MEGPIQFEYNYSLPEWPGDYTPSDFVNDKFYLPAAAMPHFKLSLYDGNVRRVQYTFNNTDPDEYQPPPCFVDWPMPDTFTGQKEWEIGHCPNVVCVAAAVVDVVAAAVGAAAELLLLLLLLFRTRVSGTSPQ